MTKKEITAELVKLRNQVTGMMTTPDFKRHRKTERALNLLRKAVDTIPIGLTITDAESRIIYTNSAEAKIHGYSVEELIGKDTRVLAPPDMWKIIPIEKYKGLKTWRRESLNIRKNGEVFPVYLISVPVIDTKGNAIGIITTCEDISKRKQAEEKLLQRQEALRSVYKLATTLGTSFKSVCDEVILNLSKLLLTSHGMVTRFEDGKITVISALVNGELNMDEPIQIQKTFQGGSHLKREVFKCMVSRKHIFTQSPYNQYHLKSLACVPIIDTSGNAVGSIVIMDPNKRRFSDDEIQLIRIFARYVAFEIEREAMKVRLLSAQKMEVIGNLAGGVAHEVRSPLSAIMIFTETLTRDLADNHKYKHLIFHIQSQVTRLAELMKDLLNLGKPIESANLRRESLNAICSASVDLWKHSQTGQSFSVQLIQPKGNLTISVTADSQRLQQVFVNLLDNAAKHSPEGSQIQFIIRRPRGKFCTIQITDCGSGIPDHLFPRIFEPFFSTQRSGTGLGLSIVKHIVETHGGRVEIFNNTPPPGCTAEIKLPLANGKES